MLEVGGLLYGPDVERLHLGPWLLEERLARGGMAEVWRGRAAHPTFGLTLPNDGVVCLKRLDPSLAGDPDFVEMFRDEARLVLQLAHKNVVQTYALYDDNPGGQPQELLLVMELIQGPSLARLVKALSQEHQQPPTVLESLTMVSQLARALQHVHTLSDDDGRAMQIVHRDVSPQNLLLDQHNGGRLVLIDFGVARAASRLTRTRVGTLKGKAAYMAPEQVRGKGVDGRTDQFASAVVLWELLCHRPLFHGNNELRVLEEIERGEIVPPSVVVDFREHGRAIDAVVMKALSFSPDDRFTDMAAFADALDVVINDFGGPADLVALVLRGLAAIETSGRASEQPTRTRVLVSQPERQLAVVARPLDTSIWTLAAGAFVVFVVIAVAIATARSGGEEDPDPPPPPPPQLTIDVDSRHLDQLESALTRAPSHPCRTELLDEILDRNSLKGVPKDVVTGIDNDVAACVAIAGNAVALRKELTRKRLLQAPPEPKLKKKQKLPKERHEQTQKRLDETTRRARLALDAGESDIARSLLEQVVSADGERIDERRLLAEAYRRSGQVALAGVEIRAWLQLRPDDPERVRLVRWLKRNQLVTP